MNALKEKDMLILKLLEDFPQGAFLWQVQKYAKIPTKQYAFYYLKKLVRKGYILKEDKLYFLVKKPITENVLLPRRVSEHITSLPQKAQDSQALRIHSLALAFPLRTPLAPSQPAKLGLAGARPAYLKNHESVRASADDLEIMLTPDNLIIYTDQLAIPLTSSIATELKRITYKAYQLAAKLEDRYSLDLRRPEKGALVANIMLNHNALTNHEVAKIVLESEEKFEVKDMAGNLRVIVDFSHHIPEFEAVSAKFGFQDVARLKDLTLAVINGDFDYRAEQELLKEMMGTLHQSISTQAQLAASQLTQSEHLNYYASQIEAHARAIVKLNEVLEKLDKLLDRKGNEGI